MKMTKIKTAGRLLVFALAALGLHSAMAADFTFALDNDGGSGGPTKVFFTSGSSKLYRCEVATRTGYTLLGYWAEKNGSGDKWLEPNILSDGKTDGLRLVKSKTSSFALKVYANWEPITYTIAYNVNGGSGSFTGGTATYDQNFTLSSTAPTKTGYTFGGWQVDGKGTAYAAGSSVKNLTATKGATVTLYAQWTENTATLSYNANGHGTAPGNATMKYSAACNAAAAITATGYTFVKWTTAQNGSGTAYNAGAQVKAANVNPTAMTLYAQWTANKYKMTFDQQSGSGGSGSVDATYDSGMPKATMPTRTGYTFGGYWTGVNGTGTQYYNADGSSTRNCNLTSATTLYAKWTANGYTVSFNQNGGTGGQTSAKTATYDAAMPDVAVPTRQGFVFRGYFDATSGGTKYYYGDGHSARTWNKTAAATLYAQWKSAAEADTVPAGYTRVGALQSSGTQWINTGYVPTLNTKIEAFFNTMSKTADWTVFFGETGADNSPTGILLRYTDGTNLNAWFCNPTYTEAQVSGLAGKDIDVVLEKNKLTVNGAETKITSTSGNPYAGSIYLFAGNKAGAVWRHQAMTLYSFKIYEGTTVVRNFIPCTNPSGAAGLYDPVTELFYGNLGTGAFTVVNPSVTVTLDPNGGSGGAANVTATFGQAMPAIEIPTRTGYNFEGYFDAAGKAYYKEDGTSAALWDSVRPVTLSAEWTAKDYDLNLDLQGGTGVNTTRVVFDVIPPMIAQPTKSERKFAGYFTEPEGAGTMVFDEYGIATEPWTTDEAITLYANWILELCATEPEATAVDMRAVKPAQVFKPEMLVTSPTGWEAETTAIFEAIGEGQPVAVVDPVTAPITVWTPQDVGLFTLTHTAGEGVETAQFNVTGFTYRVEFDANGGTGEAMAGVDLAYGTEATAPACTYTRTDYEFDGWNTRKDGSGDAIAVGEKYKNLVTDASETGRLYAQWKVVTAIAYEVEVIEGGTPKDNPIEIPTGWIAENLPGTDKDKPEDVKKELEKTDPDTGLKKWQEYVLDVKPGDKDAKVWIDSPQQKEKDKIKVKMREFSPTKGTGFQVKYRLDTQLKGANEKAKGELANSPDFDIDLSGDKDPTGLYTVNVVFVPDGKENSDEVVESVNTMGILKVPSPKTLEIVAVPWNRLAPDDNQAVLVADLVKTATLTPGDKLHVYDKAKKTYKSWKYDIEKGWQPLGTFKVSASGLEQKTVAPDQSEQTVARGSAVWLERQDASKPFYLYGQYSTNEVETAIVKGQHNLIASPKMVAFHLNGGGITGDINAKDQIIVPQGGDKPPKTYTYRSGQWGYSKFNGTRFTFDTTDDEVPVGTGFWYISKGGSPTIRW